MFSKAFKSGKENRSKKSSKIFFNPSYICILTSDRKTYLESELLFINQMDKSS